jgi:hypothetical protein
VVLPRAHEVAAWFLDVARAHVAGGGRMPARDVELLIALAPGDALIDAAIEGSEADDGAGFAALARAASARLREAAASGDEALARETVTALEVELLRLYRPARGLGRFEDDVAAAAVMLDAHEIGGDDAHLMMAEELLLGAIRRYWTDRDRHPVRVNCDAAVALARLAAQPGRASYRDRALEVLAGYAGTYRALGIEAAPFVSALHLIS